MGDIKLSERAPGDRTPVVANPPRAVKRGNGGSHEGFSIVDIVAALRRHVLLILTTTIAVASISAWSVFRETPTFRATAVLRMTDARRSMTRGLDEAVVDRSGDHTDVMLSHVQQLKSRALVGAVVDSEGLRLRPALRRGLAGPLLTQVRVDPAVPPDSFIVTFTNDSVIVRNGDKESRVAYNEPYRGPGVTFAIAKKPAVQRVTLALAPRELVIDQFLETLRVAQREETDVVDVSYADAVPEVAQRVVNRLVAAFRDADVRQSQGESRRRRIFLEEQLREIDVQLQQSEGTLTSFRSRQQVFSSREKLQAQQTALMSLDIRRGELDADRRMYATLLEKLQSPRGERKEDELRALVAAPDVSTNPVISQLYARLAQYQSARDSLTVGEWRSASSNPDVVRLDQLIEASEQRLLSAVRGHIAAVDARREALGTLRGQSASAIEALPETESAEERLSRQVQSNRNLADRLKDEYQKARMAEAVEAGQVEIVDLAPLPYRPVARLRALRLLLGLLIGLAIGAVGALALDSMKPRVRRRVDLEEDMQIPVLSIIPQIAFEPNKYNAIERFSSLIAKRRSPNAPGVSHRNSTAASLMSPAGGEAFRLLRSSLKWTQDGSSNTLAVSSALSEEGKTTTSANLAVVSALEGNRVLLIDCDLRKPRLHQVFRVPRDPGLAQVLRAGLSPSVAVRDTFVDGLSLLPAGRYTERFADFIGSDRMRELLADLSQNFDLIIIDTPPVLAVADAAALGPLVGGILFVVGAGATNRRAVEQAIEQLSSAGGNIIGAVLNDSRGEVQRYGGYDYYEYQDNYARTTGVR